MARCTHSGGNIQQFTEVCLDCGHNIYESDEDYEESLQRDISHLKAELRKKRIEQLELEKERLRGELKGNNDDNGNW